MCGVCKNRILMYNNIGVKNCINVKMSKVNSSKGLAFIRIKISSSQNVDHRSRVAPNQRFAFLFTFNGLENRIKESINNDEKMSISIR